MNERRKNWQGMNWIHPSTRLAIYLRDGLACAWCGASVEEATRLELDHLRPVMCGGDNKPTNLVTACERCNKSRGARPVRKFAEAVAEYLGTDRTSEDITRHLNNCKRRKLPRAEARALLARRGTVKAVVQSKRTA